MENIKIWHTPDEKPEDGATIAFYLEDSMGSGDYDYDENEILVNCGFIEFSRITKWAYVKELIATSRALDVAIDKLTVWKEYANPNSSSPSVYTCASILLQEISEIMKGNK